MQPDDSLPAEIERCFNRVSAALRSGSVGELAPLIERIEALMLRLGHSGPAPADLARLRLRAAEQMRLLGAARDGIRAAALRLADIRRAPGAMSTYDPAGRSRTLHFQSGSVEKHA